MRISAAAIAAVVLLATIGGAVSPVAAQGAEGDAYSGTHVQFDTTGNAIAGYAVDGDVLVENVSVQSSSEARSQAGVDVGAGLESTTDFRGAGLEIASQADASVTLEVESGAEVQSNDVARGVLQVRATDGAQMVRANLSDGAEARSDSDKRVVVTQEDGSEGAFIVVGDGEVVVDQNGGVTAEVKEGGQLVYRQYQGERSDQDEQSEQMIEEGTATAEVYVQASQESGQETAAHAVEYGQDTSVEVEEQSRDTVEMTVERSQSQGKVVLCTVSNAAFDNVEDIQVSVDGSAAAKAESYSAVKQSAQEGDEPRYYVASSSSAEAATDVAIGIDHFSSRDVTMSSSGDGSGDDGGSFADGAGFGALGALVALAAALFAARRQ
jgi:co-chaperonin GroES (HSP10)